MGCMGRRELPLLHRHAQDSLKLTDEILQFDPFEKLLRWVALHASQSQMPEPPVAHPHSSAAVAAHAWSYLAHQLDLTPSQYSSLILSHRGDQSLHSALQFVRESIVAASATSRAHVSLLDGFLAQLDNHQVFTNDATKHKMMRWAHDNQLWIKQQMTRPFGTPESTGEEETNAPQHMQQQQQPTHQPSSAQMQLEQQLQATPPSGLHRQLQGLPPPSPVLDLDAMQDATLNSFANGSGMPNAPFLNMTFPSLGVDLALDSAPHSLGTHVSAGMSADGVGARGALSTEEVSDDVLFGGMTDEPTGMTMTHTDA
jgi:hypothetical protein